MYLIIGKKKKKRILNVSVIKLVTEVGENKKGNGLSSLISLGSFLF